MLADDGRQKRLHGHRLERVVQDGLRLFEIHIQLFFDRAQVAAMTPCADTRL
jgi:hypothetical protein